MATCAIHKNSVHYNILGVDSLKYLRANSKGNTEQYKNQHFSNNMHDFYGETCIVRVIVSSKMGLASFQSLRTFIIFFKSGNYPLKVKQPIKPLPITGTFNDLAVAHINDHGVSGILCEKYITLHLHSTIEQRVHCFHFFELKLKEYSVFARSRGR